MPTHPFLLEIDPGDQITTAHSQGTAVTTVESRLWRPEYEWITELMSSPRNQAPVFRFPDLVSACVAWVCSQPGAANAVFQYLRTDLMMRDPGTERRRVDLWRTQFEQLAAMQRSADNRHPHPRYQLDQFTTACVALLSQADPRGASVYAHARQNTIERSRPPVTAIEPAEMNEMVFSRT